MAKCLKLDMQFRTVFGAGTSDIGGGSRIERSTDWHRRGWIVMLRARERPAEVASCSRRYRTLLEIKKEFEPPSIILEMSERYSRIWRRCSARRGVGYMLMVEVLWIEQDELFREIVLWM